MQAQAVNSIKPSFFKEIWNGIWHNEVENIKKRDVIEEKNHIEEQEPGYTKQLAETVGKATISLDEKEEEKSFVKKAEINERLAGKRADEVRKQKDNLRDQDKGQRTREQ